MWEIDPVSGGFLCFEVVDFPVVCLTSFVDGYTPA